MNLFCKSTASPYLYNSSIYYTVPDIEVLMKDIALYCNSKHFNASTLLLFSLVVIVLYILILNCGAPAVSVYARSSDNASFPTPDTNTINNNNLFVSITNTSKNFENKLFDLGKKLEYTQDIDANQVFTNATVKNKILNNLEPTQYTIPALKHSLLGFEISANNIEAKTESKKIDENKTRIDFPVMKAKNVKVSNSGLINLSYENVDLSSMYVIYNPKTGKFTLHIPISVAGKYLPMGF